MSIVLETERMRLRRFTESDVDNLLALDGDAEVMRYLYDGRPRTREQIERETLPAILRSYTGGAGCWALESTSDGAFLGWAELDPLGNRCFELGYRLLRAQWGRGYATEAAVALVHRAFHYLAATRVTGNTMTVNTGSRRVLAKAGLRYLRTYFEQWPEYLAGAEHGDVEYVLDRADWAAS